MDWFSDITAWALPVILAITLHEAAHGWMAEKFGDNTARMLGRVTFNPLKHVDRFGTVILPGLLMLTHAPILFGYAKPVPVNFGQLSPPRTGMFMVAIAGVLMNFFLAITGGILLHLDQWMTPEQAPWLYMMLYRLIIINCVLIIFNMLPILPLDGGRVVVSFLHGKARHYYSKLEKYGMLVIILVLLMPWLVDVNPAETIIGKPTMWLVEQVLYLTGNGKG